MPDFTRSRISNEFRKATAPIPPDLGACSVLIQRRNSFQNETFIYLEHALGNYVPIDHHVPIPAQFPTLRCGYGMPDCSLPGSDDEHILFPLSGFLPGGAKSAHLVLLSIENYPPDPDLGVPVAVLDGANDDIRVVVAGDCVGAPIRQSKEGSGRQAAI